MYDCHAETRESTGTLGVVSARRIAVPGGIDANEATILAGPERVGLGDFTRDDGELHTCSVYCRFAF